MKKILSIALLLAVIIGGVIGWRGYRDNKMPNFSGTATLYIKPGDTPEEAVRQIREQCGILSDKSLQRAFEDKQVARYITPGCYTVTKRSSSVYVARMLNNGWQSPSRLVLSGTMRKKDQIAKFYQ